MWVISCAQRTKVVAYHRCATRESVQCTLFANKECTSHQLSRCELSVVTTQIVMKCVMHTYGIDQVLLNQLLSDGHISQRDWEQYGYCSMDCGWLVQKLASYTCMCSAYTLHGSLALTLFRAHTHAQWKKLQWWEQMSIMQIHKCPKALTVIADKSNFQLDKASSYVHSSCWIHRYDYSVSQAVVIPIHNHSCDWASWHRKGVVELLRILPYNNFGQRAKICV